MDQARIFGEFDHLMGVVTEPDEVDSSPDQVAAIMITPGMLHHAGPYRLHVDLARWLSAHNIRSLRFDLSGIGESFGVGSTGCSIDRAAAETRSAMDMMQAHDGCKKFILFGLCSGADDSVHTALNDDRVAGFVIMDGCGFRTRRYYLHRAITHYLPRIGSVQKWQNLIKRSFGAQAHVPPSLQAGMDVREFPEREEAARQFQQLADRGTQMHFVYTGGIAEYYNYESQLFDMFPELQWRDTASTTFFPHMDHVAMLCEDRQQLIADVGEKIVAFCSKVSASMVKDKADQESISSTGITFPSSVSMPTSSPTEAV